MSFISIFSLRTTEIMLRRVYNPFYRSDFIYRFTKDYRDQQGLLKTLHNFTNSVIERRRKDHEEETARSTDSSDQYFSQRRKMALLDMLLDIKIDGKGLENDEIREEVDTFMFAGHDTTASAMSFLLFNLAKHQEIQAKVYEEIRSNVEDIREVTIVCVCLNVLSAKAT
jgi:cytochrome P450 family 4